MVMALLTLFDNRVSYTVTDMTFIPLANDRIVTI